MSQFHTILERNATAGDVWTWTAIDADTKLCISWLVGPRDSHLASNGFSKKLENHAAAVALHFMHYNFARIHKTLRVTPAMAAGIANHVWSIEDIVGLLEAK